MNTLLLFLLSASAWAAQPILVVGDSLSCGPFGEQLVKDLSKGGSKVTLYCAVSSAAEHWVQGKAPAGQQCMTRSSGSGLTPCPGGMPTMSKLLAANRGAKVVMALGTNSLGSPKPTGAYAQIAKLIDQAGAACEWVGPPHLNPSQAKGFSPDRLSAMEGNLNSFYSGLNRSVGDTCKLHDSRSATAAGQPGAGTSDGVHRTGPAGVAWASKMAKQMSGGAPSRRNDGYIILPADGEGAATR